jgi:hypothetical protein
MGINPWDCKPMGREGGASEQANWHAVKLTGGFNLRGQAVTKVS